MTITPNSRAHDAAIKRAQDNSRNGYVQHVNRSRSGEYYVSDWYDGDSTVASFENGKRLDDVRCSDR